MASDGQKRLWGESATLVVADVMNAFPGMVSTTGGHVVTTNWTLEVIGGIEPDLEYLNFTKFMKTNPLAFRVGFNPKEAEGWIETLEGTFLMLAYTGL